WDVDTGKELRQVTLGNLHAEKMAVSPDGKTLAAVVANESGEAGPIRLWDVSDGKELRTIIIPAWEKKASGSRAFAPDGKSLLADGGGTLYACDLTVGTEPRRLCPCPSPLWALALAPDGKTAAMTDSSTIRLLDLGSGAERFLVRGHPATVYKS